MRPDPPEVGIKRRVRPWASTLVSFQEQQQPRADLGAESGRNRLAAVVDPGAHCGHGVVDEQPELVQDLRHPRKSATPGDAGHRLEVAQLDWLAVGVPLQRGPQAGQHAPAGGGAPIRGLGGLRRMPQHGLERGGEGGLAGHVVVGRGAVPASDRWAAGVAVPSAPPAAALCCAAVDRSPAGQAGRIIVPVHLGRPGWVAGAAVQPRPPAAWTGAALDRAAAGAAGRCVGVVCHGPVSVAAASARFSAWASRLGPAPWRCPVARRRCWSPRRPPWAREPCPARR